MIVDLETERTLRKVLFSSLKNDFDAFERNLEEFSNKSSLLAACAVASDLSLLMIQDNYGGRPSPEEIGQLSEHTATYSEWIGLPSKDYAAYITALFERTSINEVLELGTSLRIPFVLCSHLLLIWCEPDEQTHQYLDRIWERLASNN